MGAKKVKVKINSQKKLANGIFSLWLDVDDMAQEVKAGQFVTVYSNDGAKLLPRPISICQVSKEFGAIRLVYKVMGEGTEEFSHLKAGDTLEIMGPLGNGFTVQGKKPILIGGGIGIPPMLGLAQEFDVPDITLVAGYRDETFLISSIEENENINLYIATDDGSAGTKGTVIDAIKANNVTGDIIYACGPKPMLKAVKAYAEENNIPCQLSLEERMACGIGACLACVCKSKDQDHHTNVHNKRICKDGPVFWAQEVEL